MVGNHAPSRYGTPSWSHVFWPVVNLRRQVENISNHFVSYWGLDDTYNGLNLTKLILLRIEPCKIRRRGGRLQLRLQTPAELSRKLGKLSVRNKLQFWWWRNQCNFNTILGGAITQAKGAFSSWWSTFQSQPAEATEEAEEALGPNGMRMSDIDLTEWSTTQQIGFWVDCRGIVLFRNILESSVVLRTAY